MMQQHSQTRQQRPAAPKVQEEKAIVLDFLKHGYQSVEGQGGHRPNAAVAQALGTGFLSLLELIPKKDVFLQPQEEVYIGEGKRDKVHHIKGRVAFEKLTGTAQAELVHAIDRVVTAHEERFITFFNKAQPLSMRMHQLELLPGLGKKHMWEVLEARKVKPFENFEDLKARVKLLPDPKGIVVKRILSEVQGKEKYRIFSK